MCGRPCKRCGWRGGRGKESFVINMVVEEDDGRCKVLLASGLWSIFPYHFYVGAGTAAVWNLRGIEKSESHQLPVCLTSGMKPWKYADTSIIGIIVKTFVEYVRMKILKRTSKTEDPILVKRRDWDSDLTLKCRHSCTAVNENYEALRTHVTCEQWFKNWKLMKKCASIVQCASSMENWFADKVIMERRVALESALSNLRLTHPSVPPLRDFQVTFRPSNFSSAAW